MERPDHHVAAWSRPTGTRLATYFAAIRSACVRPQAGLTGSDFAVLGEPSSQWCALPAHAASTHGLTPADLRHSPDETSTT